MMNARFVIGIMMKLIMSIKFVPGAVLIIKSNENRAARCVAFSIYRHVYIILYKNFSN